MSVEEGAERSRDGVRSGMWGAVELQAGEVREYALGDLRLRLRRRSEEVWMHSAHVSSGERGDGQTAEEGVSSGGGIPSDERIRSEDAIRPEDSIRPEGGVRPDEWIRWAVPAEEDLELVPRLPDRPVVVSPEQPFFLPPEGRARIFVRVPLFVSVSTTGEVAEPTILEEFPSIVLSDTWWGSFTEGELGYWLETRARREVPTGLDDPHLAICPLLLVNRSEQALPVERLAVRVEFLTLFHGEREVWTDEVQVRYRGGHEGSEIRYTGEVPDEVGGVSPLAGSREPAPRGLRARTFGRLAARVGAL